MPKLVLALLAALLSAVAAAAQDWPSRTVTMIVPFAAGSTPDSVARVVAERLHARLGQPFVVENRAGASGNLGTGAVAKADPDGHTIGVSIVGPLALNTLLFPTMPYDPEKELAFITVLASQPSILVVNKDIGAGTVEELITLLKREPGKHNYGSIGVGSLSHLSMESIAAKSGTKPVHIPYPGSPAVVTSLIRGDVQMAVLPAASVVSQAEAGQIRAIAVTSPRRSAFLPHLPTLTEAGIADVEADAWVGLVAPAKTSAAVRGRIEGEVREILAEPGIADRLRPLFMAPIGGSPEDFRSLIDAELRRWSPVIRSGNIRLGQYGGSPRAHVGKGCGGPSPG